MPEHGVVDCYNILSWVEKSCDCVCYHISLLGLVDVWSCPQHIRTTNIALTSHI